MLKRNLKDVNLIEKYVYATYRRFLTKAAQSRNKTFDEMRKVAKGRVWTGEDALKHGLVDYLGNFQTSVDLMKKRIGIDENQQVVLKFYPEELDKWQAFKQLLEDDQFPFGLVDIFSKRTNTNRTEAISDMLMLPKEIRKHFAYTQILAMIAEKERVIFALPSLIEVK
jgi:ClpP class serine protease